MVKHIRTEMFLNFAYSIIQVSDGTFSYIASEYSRTNVG